ncbi:MAG TPA: VOC family protein, partial [Actinomycetes bacterium]|nr:VOC family protein [Actinomycetes bacterium]
NLGFYRALGFEVTFQQQRPNAYAVVARGDIELQFFSIKTYDPAQSYSTCYIVTTDVDALSDAFRSGLRAALGKLPTRGLPRIGPLKDMSYGVRQFLVTDPGGNTLRIGQPISASLAHTPAPRDRFARALHTASLLSDSKGDDPAAAKLLDHILASDAARSATEHARALVLRADTAVRMDDRPLALRLLGEIQRIRLTDTDREAVRDDLRRADELAEAVAEPPHHRTERY